MRISLVVILCSNLAVNVRADESLDCNPPCTGNSYCDGSTCVCKNGFESNAQHDCEDVDECQFRCTGEGARCTNTAGSYECKCADGYVLQPDGDSCQDVNECWTTCNTEGTKCINTPGSYTCRCLPGWEKDDKDHDKCVDIDECLTTCNTDGTKCFNRPGSYTCRCLPGWEKDDTNRDKCVDIDECKDKDTCPSDEICKNKPGSYECICREGYERSPEGLCVDIDECAAATNNCTTVVDPDAFAAPMLCINTVGSYSCKCNTGYFRKAPTLTPPNIDQLVERQTTQQRRLQGGAGGGNDNNDDDDGDDDNVALDKGYDPETKEALVCLDYDECVDTGWTSNPLPGGPCDMVGVCRNTKGSYQCDCYPGYRNTQPAHGVPVSVYAKGCGGSDACCSDIDECAENKDDCEQLCVTGVSAPLNFTCGCNKEFYLGADQKKCLHCDFDAWGPYGDCNTTCGTGKLNRTRQTRGPSVDIPDCNDPDELIDFQVCQTIDCITRECVISPWGDWGNCENDQRVRRRFIVENEELCDPQIELEQTQPCESVSAVAQILAGANTVGLFVAAGTGLVLLLGIGYCVTRMCCTGRQTPTTLGDDQAAFSQW